MGQNFNPPIGEAWNIEDIMLYHFLSAHPQKKKKRGLLLHPRNCTRYYTCILSMISIEYG
jgi:hypothetical protein